jgi:predicted deacylase
VLSLLLLVAVGATAQGLRTPAERTNFRAGPTMYDDLLEFVYELDAQSDLMQVKEITETLRGREVLLCILSNPPVYQVSDVIGSDKPIVLIVNNVHGGEVAGKEASLILMRDLLFGELRPLLDDVIVLNVPSINPDGAEEMRRTNEQNFDMNRDYLKLESQEIQALLTKVIHEWQPDIQVDTHHGGSTPYVITYQTIMNPAGDAEIMRVANEMIVPQIRAALRAEDYDGFWYSGPQTVNGVDGWAPTSVEPRKQHVYSGLANTIDFLFARVPQTR